MSVVAPVVDSVTTTVLQKCEWTAIFHSRHLDAMAGVNVVLNHLAKP